MHDYNRAPLKTCLQEGVWLRGTLASEVDTSPRQREVYEVPGLFHVPNDQPLVCVFCHLDSPPVNVLQLQMSFAQKSVLIFCPYSGAFFSRPRSCFLKRDKRKPEPGATFLLCRPVTPHVHMGIFRVGK